MPQDAFARSREAFERAMTWLEGPEAASLEHAAIEERRQGHRDAPGQLRPGAARKAARAVPEQDGRLSRGEVRTRKRVAEAGVVFGITPEPRTAAGIIRPAPTRHPAAPPWPASG